MPLEPHGDGGMEMITETAGRRSPQLRASVASFQRERASLPKFTSRGARGRDAALVGHRLHRCALRMLVEFRLLPAQATIMLLCPEGEKEKGNVRP
jgi:hypothetical protein